MRIAFLTPLPPARTGIAHYSAMLLPALRERFEVDAFDSAAGYERDAYDCAVYQLGNNPHHEWIYREALERPGVAVLHDVVLHHLIVEMTLARGDADGYAAALEASHGAAGAAWARGRAAGFHAEIGNFLLPASVDLANRSRAVIVHNRWAADRLQSFGVVTPIVVAPHPFVHEVVPNRRDSTRARLGFAPSDKVIGFFGFLTSAKRADAVLAAFERARSRDPHLRLLVAGEPAPDIDVSEFSRDGIIVTGYVADEDLGGFYDAADLLVNLRYPSAGETSGTLVRAFDAGKPVAVSDFAQFAEYPDACATKIPLGNREVEALSEFFLGSHDTERIAKAQRAWLDTNATLAASVAAYERAIAAGTSGARRTASMQVAATLPLFPLLTLDSVRRTARGIAMTLRNAGDAMIVTRSYGEPAYRLIAKIFDGEREIADRWLELPADLPPGDSAVVEFESADLRAGLTLHLHHALQSVPLVESEAFTSAGIPS